jgi:transcriptional regulator with XRE-family HTH domain
MRTTRHKTPQRPSPAKPPRFKLVDQHVGDRLRILREERHMTQETLGQHVDVTFQQIQKYERGANRISASRLLELANVFKVPIEVFFDGLPRDAVDGREASLVVENLSAFARSAEGSQLISAFSQISDNRVRRQILRTIQVLTDGDK